MYEYFCKTQPSNWINVLHALQTPSHNKNETNVLNIKLKNYPAVLTIDDTIVIPCNTKPKANKNAMTVKASHTQNLCLLPLTQWNVRFLLEKSVPSPSNQTHTYVRFVEKNLRQQNCNLIRNEALNKKNTDSLTQNDLVNRQNLLK